MRTIDHMDKALRPLSSYCDRLPSSRPGKKLNRATLWRWALRGQRGRILRTVQLGSGRFTCDAWVSEFMRPGPSPIPERATGSEMSALKRDEIQRRFGATGTSGVEQ